MTKCKGIKYSKTVLLAKRCIVYMHLLNPGAPWLHSPSILSVKLSFPSKAAILALKFSSTSCVSAPPVAARYSPSANLAAAISRFVPESTEDLILL